MINVEHTTTLLEMHFKCIFQHFIGRIIHTFANFVFKIKEYFLCKDKVCEVYEYEVLIFGKT